MRKVGPDTITDPARFEAEILKTRRRGYATSRQEVYAGITAVSIPIRDAQGTVVGALTTEGPEQRMAPSRIPRLVKVLRARVEDVSLLFDPVG